MRKLDNAVAVVTGAASGIGRALAELLADKGCELAIADIDAAGLEQTAATLEAKGCTVSSHLVDVADKQRMEAFAAEVAQAHGRVHVVLNNAGVSVAASFDEHSLEDFEWIVGVNFWGVVYGCKFFLPHLQRAGWGALVNLSSMFGLTGVPMQSSYCATKFAVRGLSESLALELANENIDVISVHPGGVATQIARNTRNSDPVAHQRGIEMFERFMSPTKAAKRIVRGIERRESRIVFTPEAHLTDLFKRLYPSPPRRLVGWMLRRVSK